MFYFNTELRVSYFPHRSRAEGMDHCYDCSAEVYILTEYLRRKGLSEEVKILRVWGLRLCCAKVRHRQLTHFSVLALFLFFVQEELLRESAHLTYEMHSQVFIRVTVLVGSCE